MNLDHVALQLRNERLLDRVEALHELIDRQQEEITKLQAERQKILKGWEWFEGRLDTFIKAAVREEKKSHEASRSVGDPQNKSFCEGQIDAILWWKKYFEETKTDWGLWKDAAFADTACIRY